MPPQLWRPVAPSRGHSQGGAGNPMVRYPKRRALREGPSQEQRLFLETLRDIGPRDNAQSQAVRKATKRACQVRGWAEWRPVDGFPGTMAWHLTIVGRDALKSTARLRR
jgi:hypothetical protein